MAVIAALELEKTVAPGGGPRDADGAHRGFGAGADEPYALERRHERAHALCEGDLERAGRAEARAVARGRGDRFHETRRSVAVNERPPRHHVVDEPVAVDVFDARTRRATDEQGRRADSLERADRAVDAARENALGSREET